jgi:hypothetical protein
MRVRVHCSCWCTPAPRRALCADPRAACGGVASAQRLTSLHTHIAWDMDDGGYTTQAEQDGPYGANDWHCES